MLKYRRFRHERGFTLIELMVVIVLIGILAGIGLQYVEKAIMKSRINVDMAQGRRVKEAIDMFHVNMGRSPATIAELKNAKYIGEVVSAQTYNGASLPVTDDGSGIPTGAPVFIIDLTNQSVKVNDVSSSSQPKPVWESESR